jgi:hypothetical protein
MGSLGKNRSSSDLSRGILLFQRYSRNTAIASGRSIFENFVCPSGSVGRGSGRRWYEKLAWVLVDDKRGIVLGIDGRPVGPRLGDN